MTLDDLYTILPLIILATWALVLLMVDLWIPSNRKGITALLAAAGLVVVLGFVWDAVHHLKVPSIIWSLWTVLPSFWMLFSW
jgi:NADH:ubiquinone oxidoreductase subunit 2 (subunit N)